MTNYTPDTPFERGCIYTSVVGAFTMLGLPFAQGYLDYRTLGTAFAVTALSAATGGVTKAFREIRQSNNNLDTRLK